MFSGPFASLDGLPVVFGSFTFEELVKKLKALDEVQFVIIPWQRVIRKKLARSG